MVPSEQEQLNIDDFELAYILKADECSWIPQEEMFRRIQECHALERFHADWLLEHQKQIPVTWRNFFLIFPEKTWEAAMLYKSVYENNLIFLHWTGSRWDYWGVGHYFYFDSTSAWYREGRFVRLKEV